MSRDQNKIKANVPCLYREGGRLTMPAVTCASKCAVCGFNPAVKEDRLARLGWRRNEKGDFERC
jgi:hypothetical protein